MQPTKEVKLSTSIDLNLFEFDKKLPFYHLQKIHENRLNLVFCTQEVNPYEPAIIIYNKQEILSHYLIKWERSIDPCKQGQIHE